MKTNEENNKTTFSKQPGREWKPIPGHPKAYVDRSGLVLVYRHGKRFFLSAFCPSRRITLNGKTYRFHDLVAAAFLPEPPPQSGCIIGFRNGNRADCSAENLYWLCHSPPQESELP